MISPAIRKQFDEVLKQERLADVATSFGDADFFDEIPLYSRFDQVAFLSRFGDANELLIELALDYLERVTSEAHPGTLKRFLAITVIRDDPADYFVPSIFVCNKNVRRLAGLDLMPPSKGLGTQVKSIIAKVMPHTFTVLEDRTTVPDEVRVFVSYKTPPQGVADLKEFQMDAAA